MILQIHNTQYTTFTDKQKKSNFNDVTSDVNFDLFSSKMLQQCTQLILCKTGFRQTVQTSLSKIC